MNFLKTALVVSAFVSSTLFATEYFVAKNGSDENPGTADLPFLTITKAASVAVAGDVCYIREGTYSETLEPANSGTEDAPIVFTGFPGEKVVLTTMESLTAWEPETELIYKTTVDWDMGQENLIMIGDRVCDLARWPNNIDGDLFTLNSLRNTGGTEGDVIENANLIYDPGIPEWNWANGGSVFFYGDAPGSGWTTWRSFITASDATSVSFQLPESWVGSAHSPAAGGEFFLQGIKEAIDYEYEWYFDSSTHTLFLQLPEGRSPLDGEVSMRRRTKAVVLDGKHHIHISNLAIFGGKIDIIGRSSHNIIHQVSVYYGCHTSGVIDSMLSRTEAINVRGNHNLISQCEVAWGAGSGVWIGSQYWDGSDGIGNTVYNCNIHDFNYLGCYDAPLMVRGSNSTVIRNNTIYRGGRDCIQLLDQNCNVAYNDVHQSNLISNDCGLFYTLGGPKHTKIHHNWFHDTHARGSHYKACGIYLDNDSNGFDVYRNVVWNVEWTNIQINWNGTDINIFNNTLWNGQKAMGAWHMEGTQFSNVLVYNNLSDDDSWEPQSDKQNNLSEPTGATFVDSSGGNFGLSENSPAIDSGRVIEGYTDAYLGAAPDVGAYERGEELWIPGITWNPRLGPANVGEYGLPGEAYGFKLRTPWNKLPRTIPGIIEAENFDIGLQSEAYQDTTVGNLGLAYRLPEPTPEDPLTEPLEPSFGAYDVDISAIGENLYAVTHTDVGEWMEYTIYASERGNYSCNIRYATLSENASVRLLIDGIDQGQILLPTTTTEADFSIATGPMEFENGRRIVRLVIETPGLIIDSMNFTRQQVE